MLPTPQAQHLRAPADFELRLARLRVFNGFGWAQHDSFDMTPRFLSTASLSGSLISERDR